MSYFPRKLLNEEALETLVDILLEKEGLRKIAKGKPGKRVIDKREGEELLLRIKYVAEDFLRMQATEVETPRLVLKDRLRHLPKQSVKLHALYWSIGTGILFLNFPLLEPGAAAWMVKGSVIFIFAVPSLISRRVRLNLEHDCGYINMLGHGTIYINQLRYTQFLSFLAHEYAHHLFFHLCCDEKPHWVKEGWARFLQWNVARRLLEESGNGAFLTHVLEQVIGEIKFACQLLAEILHKKLPWKARRISTIYNANPLWRIFTGSPGFNVKRLIEHSIGTATYFWAENKLGLEKLLENKLFLELD